MYGLTEEDRILVQKAALRYGIDITWSPEYRDHFIRNAELGQRMFWNPLTNNGDAFMLAVKLCLKVKYHEVLGQALVLTTLGHETQVNVENCNGDRYAATRRAIVIASLDS